MITFINKTYAKNRKEFVNSLFNPAGTCSGFYKKGKHGVKIYDMQKELIAFLVMNRQEYFVVSAYTHKSKNKPVYMYGLTSKTEEDLGLIGLTSIQIYEAVKKVSSGI